jgi:hypothetical protein
MPRVRWIVLSVLADPVRPARGGQPPPGMIMCPVDKLGG